MKKIAGGLLIAIAGGMIALGAHSLISKKEVKYINNSSQSTPAYLAGLPGASGSMVLPDFTVAANNTIHAVVHIRTQYERKSSVYDYFFDFRDFFGQRGPQGMPSPIEATGSGVIISPDGYIVTNNHVVTESNKIEVTLNDKRTYDAQIIGLDPSTDLAVIKIDAKDLPYLVYGNSDNVQIGEWVLAVGNPFNLTSTVTAGIVSA
jgi:serine protease Do